MRFLQVERVEHDRYVLARLTHPVADTRAPSLWPILHQFEIHAVIATFGARANEEVKAANNFYASCTNDDRLWPMWWLNEARSWLPHGLLIL